MNSILIIDRREVRGCINGKKWWKQKENQIGMKELLEEKDEHQRKEIIRRIKVAEI